MINFYTFTGPGIKNLFLIKPLGTFIDLIMITTNNYD